MNMKCERVALQDPGELEEFCNFVRAEHIASYLEIGCKHGGSLWAVARALPKGSKIVAVDFPNADKSSKQSGPNLIECHAALCERGYDAHLFLGDSTDPGVVEKVRRHATFDLCLIDANHTSPFVWMDWNNYGPMAKIVAFHDIQHENRPEQLDGRKMRIDVPEVWAKIKQGQRTREIRRCKRDNGFGIIWNH